MTVSPDGKAKVKKSSTAKKYQYKAKKLIPTDEEDDVGSNGQPSVHLTTDERGSPIILTSTPKNTKPERKYNLYITENVGECSQTNGHESVSKDQRHPTCCTPAESKTTASRDVNKPNETPKHKSNNRNIIEPSENMYESIANFKCCPTSIIKAKLLGETEQTTNCRECTAQCPLVDISSPTSPPAPSTTPPPPPSAPTTSLPQQSSQFLQVPATTSKSRKFLRKSRSKKQKTQTSCHARVRSLSVGNENCFRNGRTLAESSDACLNNLRRNDLIDIIRESMEKNRLCFQSNG